MSSNRMPAGVSCVCEWAYLDTLHCRCGAACTGVHTVHTKGGGSQLLTWPQLENRWQVGARVQLLQRHQFNRDCARVSDKLELRVMCVCVVCRLGCLKAS